MTFRIWLLGIGIAAACLSPIAMVALALAAALS